MTNFKGFQSPNFTQIPNEYLDYTFSPECDLTRVQMQIMNFVFRETFGWQDKHKILVFSATDIMALLNIKKRNTVVDALNGLVEDKKFLEAIEVSNLSKKVRANIEKSLGRKLQPRQKIYRLNLIEGKKRAWDNVEEPHTDLYERKMIFKSSNQMVTSNEKVISGSNQMVTTSDNQMVTTLEAETVEAVSAKQSLNKGLNKDLNKLEEEEEVITLQDVTSFLKDQINKRKISNEKTIDAIFEVAKKCRAIGTRDRENMENYCITVIEEKMKKFGQKQKAVGSKQKDRVSKEEHPEGKEERLAKMVNLKDTKGSVDKMSKEEKEEYFNKAKELKKQLEALG